MKAMWQQFVRQPHSLWFRRVLFQVHLWAGIGTGLYVLLTSLTGSAVVFRNEIFRAFTPRAVVEITGERLTDDQLKAAALRVYPDRKVNAILRPRRNRRIPDAVPIENQAVEIWLNRDDSTSIRRLFDPYTGEDLKSATSQVIVAVAWIADLHVNLLNGERGRVVNGLAAVLFTIVAATGLIVWWPGIKSWRRSMTVQWKSNWKRFNWDLHSGIGIWTVLFVLMWGGTGIVVSFPSIYYDLVNYISPSANGVHEVADVVFRWLARIHFGNFWWPVKVLWVLIGLAPAFLFVTGTLMWWNRVLRPALERAEGETIGLTR